MKPTPQAPNSNLPNEHRLISFDGTAIHYWLWPTTTAKHKPIPVLIVHGAGEHAARYRPFAEFLNASGYTVAALDLRGFGDSGGPRAYVNRFSDYLEDLNAVTAQLLKTTGANQIHLLGHSMGGLVASAAAASERPWTLASLTLSSPCFQLSFRVPPHLRAIGAICSYLVPKKLFPTKAISELLTHDAREAQLHREDSRIVHFMSARLFTEMYHQMSRCKSLARRLTVPTAVFQAGDDRVVSARTSQIFYNNLRDIQKRWKLYPGLFHEILNETSRQQVYRDILSFLDSF